MRRLLSLLSGLQEGRRDEAVVSVLLERASGGIHLDSLVPATHTHTHTHYSPEASSDGTRLLACSGAMLLRKLTAHCTS